jgi:putative phosphoesterase
MVRIIGLISDTHGQVRAACAQALAGVELILHAGDVGGAHVLEALEQIAPVRAVHGNTDVFGAGLPASLHVDVGGLSIHVSHGHELGSPTPATLAARYGADVIVYGHTHRALVERIGRHLVVNPGAAGPTRFRLVPSAARLVIEDGQARVEIVPLA